MIETKIRKSTFSHIESELYDYFDTRKAMLRIRSDLLNASPSHDNNGGGRNTLPSDPTGRTASLIASHKQLSEMEKTVEAIETVLERLPREKMDLLQLVYWTRPQTLSWEGISQKLHVSRKTAFNWREEIINAVAIKRGWY